MGIFINKPTLLDVRLAGEYATKFRWTLTIIDPPNYLTSMIPNCVSYLKQINVLCQSTSLPSKNVEAMPIEVRGHRHLQPGRVTPNGSLTLNFYETVNNQLHLLFMSWQEAIWGHNIGVGVPYNDLVSESILITRLDNADQPLCHYKLKWCFLDGYTNPQLTGATSGPYTTSISISYNDFYVIGRGAMSLIGRNETASYVN